MLRYSYQGELVESTARGKRERKSLASSAWHMEKQWQPFSSLDIGNVAKCTLRPLAVTADIVGLRRVVQKRRKIYS